MGWLKEFRDFINRGNVIDLAVGLTVGAAFTTIVNSLVNDIILPIIGIVTGGVDFTSLSFTVGDATVAYGSFMQAVFNFLIIAFAIFWLVKVVNEFQKKEDKKAAALAAPSAEVKLLTEIRDLLKEGRETSETPAT